MNVSFKSCLNLAKLSCGNLIAVKQRFNLSLFFAILLMPYALLFKIKVQVNVCTLLYTCMYTCAIPFKRGRKYGLQRC